MAENGLKISLKKALCAIIIVSDNVDIITLTKVDAILTDFIQGYY